MKLSLDSSALLVVGSLLAASAAPVAAATISRCNVLQEGVYRPAVVVKNGTETKTYVIGSDGLTRRMVFDEDAMLVWAKARFGDIVLGASCGSTGDGTPTAVAVPVPAAAAAPPEVGGCGPCGPCGGCGPCGPCGGCGPCGPFGEIVRFPDSV